MEIPKDLYINHLDIDNLDLHDLQAVKRTIDILKERGATMYLSEEQITSILNRITELQERKWVKKHLKDTALMITATK